MLVECFIHLHNDEEGTEGAYNAADLDQDYDAYDFDSITSGANLRGENNRNYNYNIKQYESRNGSNKGSPSPKHQHEKSNISVLIQSKTTQVKKKHDKWDK